MLCLFKHSFNLLNGVVYSDGLDFVSRLHTLAKLYILEVDCILNQLDTLLNILVLLIAVSVLLQIVVQIHSAEFIVFWLDIHSEDVFDNEL